MCNEIDYAILEEYLAKPKQKEQKEKIGRTNPGRSLITKYYLRTMCTI